MNYLVFSTQALAVAGAAQVAVNLGMPLMGKNAVTGQADPTAQQTTAWDVPRQILGASGTAGSMGYVPAHPLFATYPNQWEIQSPASSYLTNVTGATAASA